ncbi:MAG: hypothetical protein K0U41_05025, partial [Gammaproteobacteria bacterium]|nr:hypothetical protein [Gammaproteobacteria bacterium]
MQKQNYLEIRHDATGLLEISNQYTLAFDADRFNKIVVLLQGTSNEASASHIPADRLISLNLRTLRGINLIAVLRLIILCRQYRVSHLLTHRYKPAFIAGLVTFF